MDKYGLIGYPLWHSFSKRYFEKRFKENGENAVFLNFEIENIATFPTLLQNTPNLKGLSVTIPHKESVIPYLDELDEAVEQIGAVNSIKVAWRKGQAFTKGYNTDFYGFGKSLDVFLATKNCKALILGTGGASKAVAYALRKRNIAYKFVSRNPKQGQYGYEKLDEKVLQEHKLIINTTPLGTFPEVTCFPAIPYQFLTSAHFLFDLVYNPTETTFMKKGKAQGAKVCNGYTMLTYQAERSWEIWNS